MAPSWSALALWVALAAECSAAAGSRGSTLCSAPSVRERARAGTPVWVAAASRSPAVLARSACARTVRLRGGGGGGEGAGAGGGESEASLEEGPQERQEQRSRDAGVEEQRDGINSEKSEPRIMEVTALNFHNFYSV